MEQVLRKQIPSDGVVNAVFTITSTRLPTTPNNALTVHYSQARR